MSAPDELRQLADHLDDTCDRRAGLSWDDVRAAAVALRHHANLLDENARLRELCGYLIDACAKHRIGVPFHSSLQDLMADIADAAAAVSPPPAPTTCPTCLGDGVVLSGGDEHDCRDHGNEDGCFEDCPDSWHQETT